MDNFNNRYGNNYVDPASGDSVSLNSMFTEEMNELVDKINTTKNYININKYNACALEYVKAVFGDLKTFKNLCPGWRVMGADAGGVLIPRLISPKGIIYYGDDAYRKGKELYEKRMTLLEEQSDSAPQAEPPAETQSTDEAHGNE